MQSAIWAGDLGLPYAFADFINSEGAQAADLYRERFFASGHDEQIQPHVAVAVWAICAESEAEARRLATSGRMAFTLLRRGKLIPVPPPEKALRFLEAEQSDGRPQAGRRVVLGDPRTVREQLQEVAREYGAEEAIVVCITYDHGARRRSYELLAETFELQPRLGPAGQLAAG